MTETEPKKGRIQKIKEKLHLAKPSDRTDEAYGILRKEAGFIPLFNIRDLEARRTEIKEVLADIEQKEYLTQKFKIEVVNKVFRLFFQAGSPWYRGLNNRELSGKVADFLWLYNELKNIAPFIGDLFMCAVQLLHLSFQALDVTNTPAYIVNTQPLITPYGPRIDLSRSDTPAKTKREKI